MLENIQSLIDCFVSYRLRAISNSVYMFSITSQVHKATLCCFSVLGVWYVYQNGCFCYLMFASTQHPTVPSYNSELKLREWGSDTETVDRRGEGVAEKQFYSSQFGNETSRLESRISHLVESTCTKMHLLKSRCWGIKMSFMAVVVKPLVEDTLKIIKSGSGIDFTSNGQQMHLITKMYHLYFFRTFWDR